MTERPKDFLCADGFLYCSKRCAELDNNDKDGRYIDEKEYEKLKYGVLCPICNEKFYSA